MPQFHETMYGKRYYEAQLPELTRQLARIADALEKQNRLTEVKVSAKKERKTARTILTKNSPGDYTVDIEGHSWHLYKDPYNTMGVWRAECTAGGFKDRMNFKEPFKKDVLTKIYQLYENTNDTRTI